MEIKTGTTRVVLLANKKAIKFARVRIVRFILRLVFSPFMSETKNKLFYEAYGKYPMFGIVKYLSVGISANRKEYRYYKETKDPRVVPTLKMFLFGLIIVQERGLNISLLELLKDNPFNDTKFFSEKYEPWQFCKINNRVCLADYGRDEVCVVLKSLVL